MNELELDTCPFCGGHSKALSGYDIHKVGCSNEYCEIYGVAFSVSKWGGAEKLVNVKRKSSIAILRNELIKVLHNLELLDEDALGGGRMHNTQPWSIRDERIHDISKALSLTKGLDHE